MGQEKCLNVTLEKYGNFVNACTPAAASCAETADSCAKMARAAQSKKTATQAIGGTTSSALVAEGIAASVVAGVL